MDSKQKASVEKKIEKLQPLEDKKDSKTINKDDDFDKEIENYHEKKNIEIQFILIEILCIFNKLE